MAPRLAKAPTNGGEAAQVSEVEQLRRQNAELRSQLAQATETGMRLLQENSELQGRLHRFATPQDRGSHSHAVRQAVNVLDHTTSMMRRTPPMRPPHRPVLDSSPLPMLSTLAGEVAARHRELLAVRALQRRFRARRAGLARQAAGAPSPAADDGFFPKVWAALRKTTLPLLALTGRLGGRDEEQLRRVRRLHTKFETSGLNFTFGFAGISLYYEGLEHFIGTPQPDLMGAMAREHTSTSLFSSHNVFDTSPRAEWAYVTTMAVGAVGSREQDATPSRVGWRLADFFGSKEAQDAGLDIVEVLSLRL